jgi:hypothetical protein
MPLAHCSKVFGAKDIKLSPLTADPSGGSATYGTSIDVPGAKSLEISGNIDTKALRGDNQLLDQFSVLQDVAVKLSFAKTSLDILAALLGGAVVDAGTTPAQKSTWSLTGASAPKYVKIEGATPVDGVDFTGGDAHFVIYKAIPSSFPGLGLVEEDYQLPSLDFGALPQLATGNKWIDVVLNETAVVIT